MSMRTCHTCMKLCIWILSTYRKSSAWFPTHLWPQSLGNTEKGGLLGFPAASLALGSEGDSVLGRYRVIKQDARCHPLASTCVHTSAQIHNHVYIHYIPDNIEVKVYSSSSQNEAKDSMRSASRDS